MAIEQNVLVAYVDAERARRRRTSFFNPEGTLLLESGDKVLLESGDELLMEG